MRATAERVTPADLQRLIADDIDAEMRVFEWLWDTGIISDSEMASAPTRVTGSALAAVIGVDGRTWRRIVAWHESELPPHERPGRPMRASEWRLLVEVSGVDVGGQMEAA